MAKISIIVPVYNVKNYLSKCVDSILSQTFKDFELILVDDGSTDGSEKICLEYEKKDKRVKVFHKENGGLSSARNFGIKFSMGEFLGFVDSDDYIEKDMYETLYNDICEYEADIAVCGLCDVYGNSFVYNKNKIKRCALEKVEAYKLVLESKILSVSAVNKLYKRSLFDKFLYPEGKTYEDAYLTPSLFYASEKVAYNPAVKYYYVHRSSSITTDKFKISDFCVIEAYSVHLKFVRENVPNLENQAKFRYLWANMVVLDKLIKGDWPLKSDENKFFTKILNEIRSNIWFILKSPFFSLKRKISTIVLFLNSRIYRKIVLFSLKKKFKPA